MARMLLYHITMRTLIFGLSTGLLLSACTGAIGDPPSTDDTNYKPGRVGVEALEEYCDDKPRDPSRVTLHRLNRPEYDNTVRDLLGTELRPSTNFPPDDEASSSGFDNNADVLTVSKLHVAKYANAAEELVEEALAEGSTFRSRYMTCDGSNASACAKSTFDAFLPQAWRRPVTDEEVQHFVGQVEFASPEGFEEGMRLALQSILLSPHFMFRPEHDTYTEEPHPLDHYEIASRLSYFLWGSMPDEALFERAAEESLMDPGTVRSEVDRMLADPKADAFFANFIGQWLGVRAFETATPTQSLFPEFYDDNLKSAMQEETLLFVKDIIDNDLPLSDLVAAKFTYLNEDLASHYNIDGVSGNEMQRVELSTDGQRGGILTQGSILTVTSHADKVSPVLRGKWILEQLLCDEPPPPPPTVEGFSADIDPTLSARARLAQHRADPECASCHNAMDPLGLSLSNYDPIGGWTDVWDGEPVDNSGTLPDGTTFAGADGLGQLLGSDERFSACATEKLLSYALGRALYGDDHCFIYDIISTVGEDASLRELIHQVAISRVFNHVGGPVRQTPTESAEEGASE